MQKEFEDWVYDKFHKIRFEFIAVGFSQRIKNDE
jgi:hypothetical protein